MPESSKELRNLVSILSKQTLTVSSANEAHEIFNNMVRTEENSITLLFDVYNTFKSQIKKQNANKSAIGSVLSQLNNLSSEALKQVRIKELAKPPKDLEQPNIFFMDFSETSEALEKIETLIKAHEKNNKNYSYGAISQTRTSKRLLNMSLDSPALDKTGVRFENSHILKSEYLGFQDEILKDSETMKAQMKKHATLRLRGR